MSLIANLRKVRDRWKAQIERRKSRARTRAMEEASKLSRKDFLEAELLLIKAIQSKFFAREIAEATHKGVRAPNQREEVKIKDLDA